MKHYKIDCALGEIIINDRGADGLEIMVRHYESRNMPFETILDWPASTANASQKDSGDETQD